MPAWRCRYHRLSYESHRRQSHARRRSGHPIATGDIIVNDRPTPTPDTAGTPVSGAVDPELEKEVSRLIVEALNLEMRPEDIDPEAPLFGDGLGLDSIDVLEVALVISKKYGFQLRSDDDDNIRIFESVRSLTRHIAAHRTT